MNTKITVVFALALALVACGETEPNSSGDGGGGSSGSSGSGASGSSGSSGSASDVQVAEGAVTGPVVMPGKITKPGEPPVAITKDTCGTLNDGGPVIDGCMTAEIHCGDVVIGNTRGGAEKLNTRFYEKYFCTPGTTQHDGGDERIYKLVVTEPQMRVLAYLDTPCADLDIAAFREGSGATCPNPDAEIPRCEMKVKKEAREFVDIRDNDPTTYWIVVEGKGEEEGAFSLSVQCEKW
jgi:hypothetical protein